MSTTTSNLGLIKPERSDNYSVDVMGNNMDIIDNRITACENRITPLEERVITVTPGNTKLLTLSEGYNLILPPIPGVKYTGSIKLYKSGTSSNNHYIYLYDSYSNTTHHPSSLTFKGTEITNTLEFSNVDMVLINISYDMSLYNFTLT